MASTTDELNRLNALIEDQTALIEQLYEENTAANKSVLSLTSNNKHLSTANDKQKSRIIQLARQLRLQKPSPSQTFTKPIDDSLTTLATSLNPLQRQSLEAGASSNSLSLN